MLPLRYPWLWRLGGWVLIVAVSAGSLLPGHSVPAVALSDKLVHAGSYFLVMIWFAGLYRRSRHVWIALGLFALGVVLDLLQGGVGTRSFEALDIAANAAGLTLAFVLSYWLLEGWCLRMERLLVPS